jgi:hypothetical protein
MSARDAKTVGPACVICDELPIVKTCSDCGAGTCEECGRTTQAPARGLFSRPERWQCATCEFGGGRHAE